MANRRFEMYQIRQVIVRMRLGETDRQLARAGVVGRRKAGELRQLAKVHGWLDVGNPLPDDGQLEAVFAKRRNPASICPSQVEPHKKKIEAWAGQGIAATTIHRALLRGEGFTGSYSSVRRFIQSLPDNEPKATVILDFAPGEAAQVDFGAGPKFVIPGTEKPMGSWVFIMTLCFSRHQYAEVVTDQKVETWLACHRRAFQWFGGIPEKIIIDNPKCAITRACAKDPEVQRAYGELAEGYGFRISPCPPRDPKKKGRVEAGVKYIKSAFLPLRRFRDISDANRQLADWVMKEAGNRIHGSTRRRPLDLFEQTERALLKPLPDVPVQIAVWNRVKVHGNAHVYFEENFYSVPFRLIRQSLWLKATDTTVQVFRELQLVAVHSRLRGRGRHSTVDDHMPPEALAHKLQDPTWCKRQAQNIGPACVEFVDRLFAHRVLDNLRAAQGTVRLAGRYGKTRLEAACQRALSFESARYRTVKTILENGLDQIGDNQSDNVPLPDVYTTKGRFLPNDSNLLH